MAGESRRRTGRASDPSWWSTGSVPDDLPSWARRGLSEAPRSSPPPPPHHRAVGIAAARFPRCRQARRCGWALAVASVAAAAVPLAISTLASNENLALPRVGTFPVVAPGSLDPGPATPARRDRRSATVPPADAATLHPLQDPTIVAAVAPAPTVAPRAVTRRMAPPPTSTTTAPRSSRATEVDATPAYGPADSDNGNTGGDASGGRSASPDGGDGGGGAAVRPPAGAAVPAPAAAYPGVVGGLVGDVTGTVTYTPR